MYVRELLQSHPQNNENKNEAQARIVKRRSDTLS